MSYVVQNQLISVQPIANTSTVQNHAVGTIVTAADPTLGVGEFVYLPGVASTAVGDVVVYDTKAGTTTLLSGTAKGTVAVAMSANVANQYGWYQISGANASVVANTAGTAGDRVYTSATAGSVTTGVTAGQAVDGMVCTVALASGVIGVQMDRPSCNGNG